jgi:ribonucleoside-diphosphate reductase alpha chain
MYELKGKIVRFELVEDTPIEEQPKEIAKDKERETLTRSDVVFGYTIKIKYIDHSFYITLNFDEEKRLLELFVNASSTSPEINAYIQALARMISNQLKYRVPIEKIIKHLDGLDSGTSTLVKFPMQKKSKFIKSIPDLLAKVLMFYGNFDSLSRLINNNHNTLNKDSVSSNEVKDEEKTEQSKETKNSGLTCPSCSSTNVVLSEGCFTCLDCGYSKCG